MLTLLSSLAEIFSIGAVLPFLAVYTSPERVYEYHAAQPIIELLDIAAPSQLLLPITVVFGVGALTAGALRLLLLWANTRLSHAIGADLSISIYRRTLYQPYSVHYSRNSSEIINGISNKTNVTTYAISLLVTLISSAAMILMIVIALFTIDPVVVASAIGGFAFIYIFVIQLTRKRLSINSKLIALESNHVIRSLQEGLGGIRDVLIDGSQETFCQIYRKADLPLRRAQGENSFISASPRYAMEAIGMLLVAAIAYFLTQKSDGIVKAIPILGAIALAAQRLLPILQQAYAAWTGIRGGFASLQDALDLLDQPLPAHADGSVAVALPFRYRIRLNQLSFRYSSKEPYVLRELDLNITKGSRVGFIGATGSGKSTLLDIIMGLLQPTHGSVEIDDQTIDRDNCRAWQKHVAHVPQAIFLSDSTIEENIAFGVPIDKIDHERVRRAAMQAHIADSIESWPSQYQTIVGERGIRLSGGQRQRIGIARALYKEADVIIFDEATSALDSKTEREVMRAIESLSTDLTLLIIAHRLSTLKNCNQIVELGEGLIKRLGSYEDIVS